MTIEELQNTALDAINQGIRHIRLTVPGRGRSRKRIAGKHGPYGRVIAETYKGCLVEFEAAKILEWVNKVMGDKPEGE